MTDRCRDKLTGLLHRLTVDSSPLASSKSNLTPTPFLTLVCPMIAGFLVRVHVTNCYWVGLWRGESYHCPVGVNALQTRIHNVYIFYEHLADLTPQAPSQPSKLADEVNGPAEHAVLFFRCRSSQKTPTSPENQSLSHRCFKSLSKFTRLSFLTLLSHP